MEQQSFGVIIQAAATPEHVLTNLQLSCSQQTEGTLCGPQIRTPLQFRFEAVDEHGIRLDVEFAPADFLAIGTLCSLYYAAGTCQHMFNSQVVRRQVGAGYPAEARVWLALPRTIDAMQTRQAERLAIGNPSLVGAVLEWEGVNWHGVVADLSPGGCCVKFDSDEKPGLEVGKNAWMLLSSGERSVRVRSQVRWARGTQFGFCFELDSPLQNPDAPEGIDCLMETIRSSLGHADAA